jgi:hypothetical protein
MHEGNEKFVQYLENQKGRGYSEDLVIDGRMILKCILRK